MAGSCLGRWLRGGRAIALLFLSSFLLPAAFGDIRVVSWLDSKNPAALDGGHDSGATAVAWSPSASSGGAGSTWIASGAIDADAGLRIWGAPAGSQNLTDFRQTSPILTLRGHTPAADTEFYNLFFSSTGRYLVSSAADQSTRIWGSSSNSNILTWSIFPIRNITCSQTGSKHWAYASPFSPNNQYIAIMCIPDPTAITATTNTQTIAFFGPATGTSTNPVDWTAVLTLVSKTPANYDTSVGISGVNYYTFPTAPIGAWHPSGFLYCYAAGGAFSGAVLYHNYVGCVGGDQKSAVISSTTYNWVGGFPGDIDSKITGLTAGRDITGLAFRTGTYPVDATTGATWLAVQQSTYCYVRVRTGVGNTVVDKSPTGLGSASGFFWYQQGLFGNSIAWSPDGKYLAVSCSDSIVRIFGTLTTWDVEVWSLQPVRTLNTDAGTSNMAVFSASGEFVASATASGKIIVFGGCSPGQQISGYTSLATCVNCPVGWYTDRYGGICKPCDLGTYNTAPGSSTCLNCGVGNTTSALGSVACSRCATGLYGPEVKNSPCPACDPGSFTSVVGKSACTLCSSGRYAQDPASAACTACETGRYSNTIGAMTCLACPIGRIATGGASDCTPCTAGKVAPTTGLSACA